MTSVILTQGKVSWNSRNIEFSTEKAYAFYCKVPFLYAKWEALIIQIQLENGLKALSTLLTLIDNLRNPVNALLP